MSEERDRSRDRSPDTDDLGLLRGMAGDSAHPSESVEMPEIPGTAREAETSPPEILDEAAVEAHRAAKRERVRKRQQATRQGNGNQGGKAKRTGKGSALPALRPDLKPDTPALRAERVEAIRRDLVRRRRRKGSSMLLRLWAFVVFPTLFVAWFLWFKASDLYLSESSFTVQTAAPTTGSSSGGLLGGLFGGSGAGVWESTAVQNFILSRDVLRRLDEEFGIIAHYRSEDIDIIHRDRGTSFEDAHAHYQDMVTVSFDPTEGQLEMTFIAATADAAREFSAAVIRYSEEMVDELQDPIRSAALKDADANLANAELRLEEAQLEAARVRNQLQTFSVEGAVSSEMGIISGLESERERLRTRLATLIRITSESDARVQQLRAQIETISAQIQERRGNVTGNAATNQRSLADINAELERASFAVQSAMAIFAAAIETREAARKEVNRQHRYLAVIEQPSLPDRANYPRKWETTALAFLCFLGIYIIASLTISLIREQASI